MEQFSPYGQSSYAQNYPLNLEYSTPYGNDSSGSTGLSQEQSHSLVQNLSIDPSLEQQPASDQFTFWNDGFVLPHQTADPRVDQQLAANRIDISDIQNVARDANEAPWSAFNGPYMQNDAEPLYQPQNAYRSYTITGASISPGMPRSSFGHAGELSTISPDSGFESARPTSLGQANFLQQPYIPEVLDRSQPSWNLPPPRPTSVKSAPQALPKRRPPKLPVPPPCSFAGCGKTFKNQSEAKYVDQCRLSMRSTY